METIGSTTEFIYQEEYGGEECISTIQFTHFSCSVTQFHNYRYAGIIGGDGKRTHARTSSKGDLMIVGRTHLANDYPGDGGNLVSVLRCRI